MKDKYIQRVKDKFESRSQAGIEKYNTTLERQDIDLKGWLVHLQEECMDAAGYIERILGELENFKNSYEQDTSQKSKSSKGE